MSFMTGVVGVIDEAGDRIDRPDANGDYAPIVLKLDSSMASESKTEAGFSTVTIGAAGEGGGVGAASVAALEMLAGIAGAALMGTNTRFFFGCAGPLTMSYFDPWWAEMGYGAELSAAEVSKVVGVAGRVMRWSVLFLEPGVGTSHFDFAIFKNGGGTLPGIQLVPTETGVVSSGDIGDGILFEATDTIGLRIYCDGPNVTTPPSKVWIAITYLPD